MATLHAFVSSTFASINHSTKYIFKQLFHSGVSEDGADSINRWRRNAILFGFGSAFLIYQLFGVRRVNDKIEFAYKQDSALVKSILKHTNLKRMSFNTCLAGKYKVCQMPLMLLIEDVYRLLRK